MTAPALSVPALQLALTRRGIHTCDHCRLLAEELLERPVRCTAQFACTEPRETPTQAHAATQHSAPVRTSATSTWGRNYVHDNSYHTEAADLRDGGQRISCGPEPCLGAERAASGGGSVRQGEQWRRRVRPRQP